MTRINLIDPVSLCDQHLLAEHRELTRIPNTIASGKAKLDLKKIPPSYVLGTGHVCFFYDKLQFLLDRYTELHSECLERGFNVSWKFPLRESLPPMLFGIYAPSVNDKLKNIDRILERAREMKSIKYNSKEIDVFWYDTMIYSFL